MNIFKHVCPKTALRVPLLDKFKILCAGLVREDQMVALAVKIRQGVNHGLIDAFRASAAAHNQDIADRSFIRRRNLANHREFAANRVAGEHDFSLRKIGDALFKTDGHAVNDFAEQRVRHARLAVRL